MIKKLISFLANLAPTPCPAPKQARHF